MKPIKGIRDILISGRASASIYGKDVLLHIQWMKFLRLTPSKQDIKMLQHHDEQDDLLEVIDF